MGHGKRRVVYDKDALPQSAAIMGRCLVYQVPIKLTEERLQQMCTALEKAASAV